MTDKPIGYSVNTAVLNKPEAGSPMLAYLASGWSIKRWAEPKHLIEDVKSGYAVAPGWFDGGVKDNDHFKESQYWLLDFDYPQVAFDDLHKHQWFKEHALFAYTTASFTARGSYRVVGAWDKPIRTVENYRQAGRYLHELFPDADTAMERASQCSYGNTDARFISWDFNNRTPLQLKERTVRGITTGQDAFLDLVRSLDQDSEQERIAKAKLCLQYVPERGESGSDTYNNAWDTVCAITHEFGSELALQIFEECNWHGQWDLEAKVIDAETSVRGEGLRLGSLIELVRSIITDRDDSLEFERKLAAINKVHKHQEYQPSTAPATTPPATRIAQIVEKLVELELDIDNNNWAEQQTLIKEATSLGPSRTDVNNRVFDHVCDYLGVDLGSTKGNQIKTKGIARLRKLAFAGQDPWLVDRYLQKNRDAIIFGDSGSGKTAIAMDMVRCLLENKTFADGKTASNTDKKILFIASDGGSTAELVLAQYLQQMDVDDSLFDHFDFWAADCDGSAPPWNLKTGNLIKLRDTVATGEYDLVIIDSLKAVCSQTRYSIDDRGISDIMRLVQSVVCPHAALLWIHHTNKSGSSSSHSAGGATDIIEVVSAAFQVKRQWNDGQTQQKNTMVVHKLRGCDTRTFNYDFNFDEGLIPEQQFTVEAKKINDRKTSYPEVIMVALRDHKYGRMGRSSLAERFGVTPNTLDPYLTELKNDGLIRSQQGKYTLTTKGTQVAGEFTRKKYEEACSKDENPDF
jgi:predicted transcriptional regulator